MSRGENFDMKLISTFKDYYDFAIYRFFSEDKKPWVRQQSMIDLIKDKSYEDIFSKLKSLCDFHSPLFNVKNIFIDNLLTYGFPVRFFDYSPICNAGIISIADKVIPIIYYKVHVLECKPNELDKLLVENKCSIISGNKYDGYVIKVYTEVSDLIKDLSFDRKSILLNKNKAINELKNWFDFIRSLDLSNISLEFNTPIWFYSNYKLVKNPNLQALGVTKILDGTQVAQIINQFFDNVMVSDEIPKSKFPPLTDVDKLESHGFDKKISFRKVRGE